MNKLIGILVLIFENLQGLFNIEIYSIFRIKKESGLDKVLTKVFKKSYEEWLKDYKNNKEFSILHNITYNHWIRNYSAYRIIINNPLKKIIFIIYTFLNILAFSFFIFKLFFIHVSIIDETKHLEKNDNKKSFFVTSLKPYRFYKLVDEINHNFKSSYAISNIKLDFLRYKNFNNKLILGIIIKMIKYFKKYPFLIRYHRSLFNSLYIYENFKLNRYFRNKYHLSGEIYTMENRALSLASIDFNGKSYYIDFTKHDTLPYDPHSLNREKDLIKLKEKLLLKTHKTNYSSSLKKTDTILIQASDSFGTISSYEQECYSAIIYALKSCNFKGNLEFKFHPANLKISILLKKFYCINELKNYHSIIPKFLHREKNIEYFASKNKIMISIDYSTSFEEIIKNGTYVLYFNYRNRRPSINPSNEIFKKKNFKVSTNTNDLIFQLKKII